MKEDKPNEGVVHNSIIKTEEGQAAAAQATAGQGTTTITIGQQQPAAAYPQQQPQQLQMQQQAPYDPMVYAGQPAGYAPHPGAPPVYAPQVSSLHLHAHSDQQKLRDRGTGGHR